MHFGVLTSAAKQQSTYATVAARLAAAEAPRDCRRSTSWCAASTSTATTCARLELAELLISRRDFAPAMHQLLEIVKRDRTFRDDVARRKLLAVFEMAAEHPDLVAEYRSRLSSLLF
jgi:putative thioredoxin